MTLSTATGDWLGELYRPGRYLRAVQRLSAEDRRRRRRDDAVPGIAQMALDARAVGKALARDIRSGAYRPTPASTRLAQLDKERELLVLTPIDRVVHTVVGELLAEVIEPMLPDSLYSYRKGRSAQQALRVVGDYLRAHRDAHADPRQRGLYLLRADVAAYGDSIRMDARAPIWPMLEALAGGVPEPGSRYHAAWRVVVGTVHQPIVADGEACPAVGVPTGSPVVAAIANLYLGPLDRALGSTPDGLYLRYGDDFLFAHRDRPQVDRALDRARAILEELGLALNRDKLRLYWFNGAARPDPSGRAAGVDRVDYLGCTIQFGGTVSLTPAKANELLADVAARVRRSARLLEDAPVDQRIQALTAMLARGMDAASPGALRQAALINQMVDDRAQLRDLDYRIALVVAESLSGRRGPRAFRAVPYRRLRDAGLPSLVVRRNRGERW